MALSAKFSKQEVIFGVCYICYIFGFAAFMNGLISPTVVNLQPQPIEVLLRQCPQSISKDLCILQEKLHQTHFHNHCERVVIILIDALRADFISPIKKSPKFNTAMNFTEKLLNSGLAISFVTQGFAPTVTLPRIKTLVTGTISNFLDIIINFNALKLTDDNVLKQATLSGLKSIFYGDDTWLKLFPDIFIRSEGTHSFFVSDFKEVDFNVSRHIKTELNNKDWNIMILHFLGVDHIGHAYSPLSEHLPRKLIEMDGIIQFIYESLKNSQSPSLMIICGDHGMTTSGSHGGITQDELLTPLIFINTAEPKTVPAKSSAIIDQVDFVPTLSSVLGVSIPANNFGTILPNALDFIGFSAEEILFTAYYNLLQLSRAYKKAFNKEIKNTDLLKETTEAHFKLLKVHDKINFVRNNTDYMHILKSYNILLDEMKQDLLNTISGYNEFSMILGIMIMWISLLFSFYFLWPLNIDKNTIFIHCLKKIPKFNIVLLAISVIFLYCKMYIEIIFIPLCTILLLVFYMVFLLFEKTKVNSINSLGKMCLIFLCVHALSLFSSSYIEEEHQTWYFLSSTVIVLTCCWRIYHMINLKLKNSHSYKFLYNFGLMWNQCSSSIYIMFALLSSLRVFRKWNQVGNKWQHLSDISDWLNEKENVGFLILSIMISQSIIIIYFRNKLRGLNYFLFCIGTVCISLQKIGNCVKYLHLMDYIMTMLIPWSVYVLIILIIISTFVQAYLCIFISSTKQINFFLLNFISVWVLLVEVIGRPFNVPLISVVLVQEYLLSKILWTHDIDLIINVISYLTMAMASFFCYGNSNSFSTIDVFTGYTGVQSYMPVIVTLLLICNTYSTVVLWLIMFPYRFINFYITEDFKSVKKWLNLTFLFLLQYKLFILTLYSIVIYLMRHHLFIFSVFFPKLFYEFSNVILFSVIYIFVIFITNRAK